MLIPTCGPTATPTELVTGLYEEVWTLGRLDLVPSYIHSDYTMLDERGEMRVRGQDEFCEGVAAYRTMFEDVQMCATHLVQNGDQVAYRWEMTGWLRDIQNLGPGLRIMVRDVPDMRLISARGMSIARLSDGLVIEKICETDAASLTQQLGWWK